MIYHPDQVVFDECHFGSFISCYIKGTHFFDIHPPLGKLILAYFSYLAGYDGNFDFYQNSNYKNFDDYVQIRMISAFFSSLCVPLAYIILRFDNFSQTSAFTSSFLILTDTSLLVEHKFILSDGMLHFFSMLFFAIFSYTNSLQFLSKKWIFWMILTGISLGAACSCKNTADGLMVLCAFSHFLQSFENYSFFSLKFWTYLFLRGILLIIPMLFIFYASFFIHFIVLPYKGPGDGFLNENQKNQLFSYSQTSPNNIGKQIHSDLYARRLSNPNLFEKTNYIFIRMHKSNMDLKNFHPYMSRPCNWPLLTGNYVAFWNSYQGSINCQGNVFVYYPAFLGVIFVISYGVYVIFLKNQTQKIHSQLDNLQNESKSYIKQWLIALRYAFGYCVSYFPFYFVPRSMFLYHYQIPLMIGCLSAGAALDLWLPAYYRGILAVLICSFAAFGFYLWSPYAYGIPHLDSSYTIWTDNWIYGDYYHRTHRKYY